ncbi:MAG: Nramp family divalent metal transporter [Planctomycetaceae bacterium]
MRSTLDFPDEAPAPVSEMHPESERVPAGCLAPWEVDSLEPAPRHSWRDWTSMIGPGVLLAGSSVGAGEWLFGPAVTAQFGGTFLWLATISIVTQTFYNLEVMRYTLYCGEPIFAGLFRLVPGPKLWTGVYLILCIAHIWPFMASNAAVPLSAAILGHLPGDQILANINGYALTETGLVKILGYVIFLLAFLPLIFGGKIYNILERMMTWKLIIVLGFLISVTGFMTSPRNMWEVVSGFFRFGEVAIRAETVIAGSHFNLTRHDRSTAYTLNGTLENNETLVTAFIVHEGEKSTKYGIDAKLPPEVAAARTRMLEEARLLAKPGKFRIETTRRGVEYQIEGSIQPDGRWNDDKLVVRPAASSEALGESSIMDEDVRRTANSLVENQGFERRGIIGYMREHGGLPPLDWPLLAAFSAIAGAGMLSNALFSNYARDKGWGMGAKTGAIPSAIGGHQVSLSHVGKVFEVDDKSLVEWRGWFRHIMRDQVVWMFCSVVGLALPCMLSLEFIRNAPVSDTRVAALTAQGLSMRFPEYAGFWWVLTLFVSFIVLAPNAVFGGDLVARLWTDIIWIGSKKAKEKPASSVKKLYYSILAIYGIWGLAALTFLNPMQIAKVGAILGNVALGFSAFHTLIVNRTFLPKPLRPNLFMQFGLFACGAFFLAITAITVHSLLS